MTFENFYNIDESPDTLYVDNTGDYVMWNGKSKKTVPFMKICGKFHFQMNRSNDFIDALTIHPRIFGDYCGRYFTEKYSNVVNKSGMNAQEFVDVMKSDCIFKTLKFNSTDLNINSVLIYNAIKRYKRLPTRQYYEIFQNTQDWFFNNLSEYRKLLACGRAWVDPVLRYSGEKLSGLFISAWIPLDDSMKREIENGLRAELLPKYPFSRVIWDKKTADTTLSHLDASKKTAPLNWDQIKYSR